MEYIRVTKRYLEKEHICCALSNNKVVQVSSKTMTTIDWFEPLTYDFAPGKPEAGRYMTAYPDWLQNGKPRPSQDRKTAGCFKFFTKDSPILLSGLLAPVRIWSKQKTSEEASNNAGKFRFTQQGTI